MNALARDLIGSYFPENKATCWFVSVLLVALMALLTSCASIEAKKAEIDADADKALMQFQKEFDWAENFLDDQSGYLVFPSVIKMGAAIGGETGKGVLRVGGQSVAYYRTSSASIGFQLGIQSKSLIVAFQTIKSLNQFRASNGWQAGVDGSIAVLNAGANKNFRTDTNDEPVKGVVFGAKGLMYNLTFEGTKFTRISGQTIDQSPALPATYFASGRAPETEREAIDVYFGDRDLDAIEGVWQWGDSSYLVAIIKNDTGVYPAYEYVGVTIRSYSNRWNPGQVKLLINSSADAGVYTGGNFSPSHEFLNSPYVLQSPNVMTMSVLDPLSYGLVQEMVVREYPSKQNGLAAGTQGTCFLVSSDGIAITSQHVVDQAKEISIILADGTQVPAVVTKQSSANDISILKMNVSSPDYLSLAPTKSVQLGEQVFTIGYPVKSLLGSNAKFTEGSISALSGIQDEAAYMQVSIPIQPGNSGGPVVDHSGNVVGVIASTLAVESFYRTTGSLPQGVNWAVKSDYVLPMLNEQAVQSTTLDRNEAISRVQKSVCQVIVSR
jgi:lipid-binding SYLF domain-containing protein